MTNSDPTQYQPKFMEEEEQSILTVTVYNAVRNNFTEKQPHNGKFINPIYNKYQIISQKKKARKDKSMEIRGFEKTKTVIERCKSINGL